LIVGRENINRAVQGDVVAIQILPESEWRGTTDTIVEEGDITRGENADVDAEDAEVEEEVESRERKILKDSERADRKKGVQITAKVVGIIKRNWRTYIPSVSPFGLILLFLRGTRLTIVTLAISILHPFRLHRLLPEPQQQSSSSPYPNKSPKSASAPDGLTCY